MSHEDNNANGAEMNTNADDNRMPATEGANNRNPCQPIVNALLTFTISILHNSTDPKLVDIIGRYFDIEQVKDAKMMLCDAGNIQYKKRQDSELRTEKMAHIRDIVDVLRKLDRDNSMPFFVVDSVGLAGLPRINAEDISYVAVAEKITDLFSKMEIMNITIAANTTRSIENEDKLKTPVQRTSYSNVHVSRPAPSREFPELVQKSPNRAMKPPPRPQTPRSSVPTAHKVVTMSGPQPMSGAQLAPLVVTPSIEPIRVTTTAASASVSNVTMNTINTSASSISSPTVTHSARDTNTTIVRDNITSSVGHRHQISHSSSRSSVNSMNNYNHNDWQVPRDHVRSLDRRRRQRIEGTASGSNVRGAPPRTRELFIYRVDKETSDDEVRMWISKQKVKIVNFELLSHTDSKYKSYKLSVSIPDYLHLYKPGHWPIGVCIARYIAPRRTEIH